MPLICYNVPMPYNVYLKKGEERRVYEGHPWVYANEVLRIDGKDKNGSAASVFSYDGRYIGKGFINHFSKILVRIISRSDEEIDGEFFISKLKKAKKLRDALGYSECYRAVFSESDGLPGLIADRFGSVVAVQFLSLGMDLNKKFLAEAIAGVFGAKSVYERSDSPVRAKEGLKEEKGLLFGEPFERAETTENGLKISVDVINGQKTGYFLDQKENRFAIRRYVKNLKVLDCFSNSGGFSLNAAAGGASSVTAADVSESALSDVKLNASLNGFENIETVRADVFGLLRKYREEKVSFGAVVLDPPAFAKSADSAAAALKGYRDINISALKIIEDGGYLFTSSCTHFVSADALKETVWEAARSAGVNLKLLESRGQAPDHPRLLAEPESDYLKFLILSVEKR